MSTTLDVGRLVGLLDAMERLGRFEGPRRAFMNDSDARALKLINEELQCAAYAEIHDLARAIRADRDRTERKRLDVGRS